MLKIYCTKYIIMEMKITYTLAMQSSPQPSFTIPSIEYNKYFKGEILASKNLIFNLTCFYPVTFKTCKQTTFWCENTCKVSKTLLRFARL